LLLLLLALLEGGDLGVEAGDDALPACGGVAGRGPAEACRAWIRALSMNVSR
jgi:hypothetical protein